MDRIMGEMEELEKGRCVYNRLKSLGRVLFHTLCAHNVNANLHTIQN